MAASANHSTRYPARQGAAPFRGTRAGAGGVEKVPHISSNGLHRHSQKPSGAAKRSSQEFKQAMTASHPVCVKMIREADQRYQQLAVQLEQIQSKAAEERARFQSMVNQANAEKQGAHDEIRRLKAEASRLQEHVGSLESDPQGYISRAELNVILQELHTTSASVTDKISRQLDESNNAFLSTCLPGDECAETTWKEQNEQLGISGNPLLPDYTDPMLAAAGPQNISYMNHYAPMP